MLRENVPLPGLEALQKIVKGLGISLDWLVFGEGFSANRAYDVGRGAGDMAFSVTVFGLSSQFAETVIANAASNFRDNLKAKITELSGRLAELSEGVAVSESDLDKG